jgi:hypothetical protein
MPRNYYPLISRTIAALETNSALARQNIYDRARRVLLAQLNVNDSRVPFSGAQIAIEKAALEAAISQVEAEILTSDSTQINDNRNLAQRLQNLFTALRNAVILRLSLSALPAFPALRASILIVLGSVPR